MPPTPQTGEAQSEALTPEAVFGMRLRRARERQGISLREMARRLTRSHSNLWDYERGHRLATIDIVTDYERELGLATGELQEPLEAARREVYGQDRDRRRPFRAPAPAPAPASASASASASGRRPPLPALLATGSWQATRPKGPFAGRDREMAAAQTWLDEAGGGEPRLILVEGEAGIGKSTLLTHLLEQAGKKGWQPLRGFCLQGARIAYLPLASALAPLRSGTHLSRPAAPDPLSDLLETELFGGNASDTDATTVTGGIDEVESDAAADRRHLNLVVTAARAVLNAADQRPLILALEDVHWADESTLGFLELLCAVATQKSALTPVTLALILTSRRTQESEPAGRFIQRIRRETTCRELELAGLNSLEVNQVVTELAHARPSRRLLHSITEASSGNPLLVRSLLERLMGDGAISVRGDHLSGNGASLPAVALDLDAELAGRLGRVSGAGADLLTWAAVLGDGNSVTALQAVTRYSDDEFDRLISLTGEARLLYEEGESYRFDHPELREVLYARLPNRQRRRRHLAVAERLEEHFGADSREVVTQIGHHLSLAGPDAPVAKLASAARRAAEQSFALAAWSDAAAYYDLYLATDKLAENDPGVLWRAGLAHFRNHDHREAEERLLRAVDMARAAGDERTWGRAVLTLTKSRVTGGSWLGAEIDVEPLRDFLRQRLAGVDDLRARAYSLLSDADFSRFDFAAGFEEARRALEVASGGHDDEVSAEVELALSIQHLAALQLHQAEEHLQNCEQSAARLADPWASSWAASRLPLIRWCRGDLAAAEAQATSAADLAAEHFDWAEVSLATACRVNVAVAQGRTADAERLGTLATQQYLRSDYQWTVLILAPALIMARAFQGRAIPAQAAIEMVGRAGVETAPVQLAVDAILGDIDAPSAVGVVPPAAGPPPSYNLFDLAVAAMQVEVCDRTGNADVARAALGPLEAAHRAGFEYGIGWVASVPRLLGVVYRCLGRYNEAETWLREAVALATRAPAPAERARAQLNLAQLLTARGDERAAITALDESARTFEKLGLSALLARSEQLRLIVPRGRLTSACLTVCFLVEVSMPGMPYNLEQGPYLAMLEDLINKDPQRCLRSLRDPDRPVTDLLRDPPIPIQGGPYPTTAELADHIDGDWFGIEPDSRAPTGTSRYWSYWRGDAQGIVRETIVRAIEVALGVGHDETPGAGPPSRQWHISLLTACGIRWFEGWISWRRVGDAPESGHVVVLLLTPTHGKPAEPTLLRPTRSAPGTPGTPYQVNPARAEGGQGLWAVGALLERRHDPDPASAQWVSPGDFPRPQLGPTYESLGEVVVVAPSEAQGGVLPEGRRYQEAS